MLKSRCFIGLMTLAVSSGLTGCSLFGGGSDGTPKVDATHINAQQQPPQQQDLIKKLKGDAKTLHDDIDQLVGWGKVDDLKAGNNWGSFNNGDAPRLEQEMKDFQTDLTNATLGKKTQMQTDLANLRKLTEIAKSHHDKTGGQALTYCHRISEDLNYYLTGSGEEYGISHTEAAKSSDYQSVDDFLRSNSH